MPGRVRPSRGRGPVRYNALRREFSSPSPNRLPVGQKGGYSETSQPATPWWVWLLSKMWSSSMGMEQGCAAGTHSIQRILFPTLLKEVVNRGWFLLAGAGVKAQICSLVELLATTLNQAHALFYTLPEGLLPEPSLPCGLLFSTLDTITGQHPPGELLASLSYFLAHSADCYWQVPSAGYCARLWGDSSELGRCGPSFVEVAG